MSGPSREDDAVEGYRWTCPICGARKNGLGEADRPAREKAVLGLVAHVRTTGDEAHGGLGRYPDGFDPADEDAVAEHVEFWRS